MDAPMGSHSYAAMDKLAGRDRVEFSVDKKLALVGIGAGAVGLLVGFVVGRLSAGSSKK